MVKAWENKTRFRSACEASPVDDFACVEVLRPSQPNGVMSIAVRLSHHTLLGRLSPLSG